MDIWHLMVAAGVPTAIMGFVVWWWQRKIIERDEKKKAEELAEKEAREEREKNTEKLMLMIMQTSRATNVLAEATARAVARIPDAHCNGDMKAALEESERIQREEQAFLFDQGVKHIFGD